MKILIQGEKSDIWSCGIVIYSALMGELPFSDNDIQDLYDKILYQPLILPDYLSEQAQELLHGLLEKNPNTR